MLRLACQASGASDECCDTSTRQRRDYVLVGGINSASRDIEIPLVLSAAAPACFEFVSSSRDGNLGGGVTYELQYRSRVGQDWILIPTKTSNKILTGLVPGHVYDFRVRAVNAAGWGEFSSVTELKTPSDKAKGGGKTVQDEDDSVVDSRETPR